MAVGSLDARRRVWLVGLAAVTLSFAWLLQLIVLSVIPMGATLCNLPLIVTIVWGSVFGSPLQMPRADELRHVPLGQVVAIQLLSGSPSGALVGAFFGALFGAVLPVFPFNYPLIGWIAGYFTLRTINQGILLVVPLVLLLSVLGETLMAGQLYLFTQMHIINRPDVFRHLVQVAVPESIANALIAPFVYYPIRTWYEFTHSPAQGAER